MGGGCINSASVVPGGGQEYFVKTNRAELIDMFEAEGEALSVGHRHEPYVSHDRYAGVRQTEPRGW